MLLSKGAGACEQVTCGNLAARGCCSCGTALASALEDFLQGCCLPSVPTEQRRVWDDLSMTTVLGSASQHDVSVSRPVDAEITTLHRLRREKVTKCSSWYEIGERALRKKAFRRYTCTILDNQYSQALAYPKDL